MSILKWFLNLFKRATPVGLPAPSNSNPYNRRWADTSVKDQGDTGQCSAYAVTAAMENFLEGKQELSAKELFDNQNQFTNLTAALNAAWKPGVGGHSLEQYTKIEVTGEQLELELKHLFLRGCSLVVEVRQSAELNSESARVYPTEFYNSWHAMAVIGLEDSFLICKDSFGINNGDNGYRYYSMSALIPGFYNLYAIIKVIKRS